MSLLRCVLALVITAIVVALADAPTQGPRALAFISGALLCLTWPLIVIEVVSRWLTRAFSGSQRERTASAESTSVRIACAIVAVGPPMIVWGSRSSVSSPLLGLTIAALLAFAMLASLGLVLSWRRLATWFNTPGHALLLAAILAWTLQSSVIIQEGVLIRVRPGTEMMHLALFMGTWAGACATTLALGAAWAPDDELAPAAPRHWLALVCLSGAGLTWWIDRNAFEGAYFAVHLWLQASSVLLVFSSARLLLGTICRPPKWTLVLASTLTLTCVAVFLLDPRPSMDIAFRSRLADAKLARNLLRLRPLHGLDLRFVDDPRLAAAPRFDAAPGFKPQNALLITVDTLRADALTDMPRVQAFGRDALVFHRAYAPSNATALSIPTLFYGRYVGELDWRRVWVDAQGRELDDASAQAHPESTWLDAALLTSAPSQGDLVQRLRQAGLATSAVVDAGLGGLARPHSALRKAFEDFEALAPAEGQANAQALVDASARRISAYGEQPWFHWLHIFDPHETGINDAKYDPQAYKRLVSGTDAALGEFLDTLESQGRLEDTVIIISADHGEALGEHGQYGHNSSLFEEQIHVPLIVYVPGLPAGESAIPVSLIDIAPTLTWLFGESPEGFSGHNLIESARSRQLRRPVFSERLWYRANKKRSLYDAKAIIWGDDKLIWDRKSETVRLYDLAADPAELADQTQHGGEVLADLQRMLRGHVARAEREHPLP